MNEFLIDTHCAFYNGRVSAVHELGADDRAFAHLRFLMRLIPHAGLSRSDTVSLVGPSTEAQVAALQKAKCWGKAAKAIERAISLVPDHVPFQDQIILVRARENVARLKNREGKSGYLSDARALLRSARRIRRLLRRFPRNATVYETLGHLYHLRAVKLLNGQVPSEALLSVEQSLAHYPGLEAADRSREAIRATLGAMRTQYAQLQTSLAWIRSPKLNTAGEHLKSEVTKGDAAARRYAASAEAKQTTAAHRVAQAHQIWGEIGLPTSRGIDDATAQAFVAALGASSRRPRPARTGSPRRGRPSRCPTRRSPRSTRSRSTRSSASGSSRTRRPQISRPTRP